MKCRGMRQDGSIHVPHALSHLLPMTAPSPTFAEAAAGCFRMGGTKSTACSDCSASSSADSIIRRLLAPKSQRRFMSRPVPIAQGALPQQNEQAFQKETRQKRRKAQRKYRQTNQAGRCCGSSHATNPSAAERQPPPSMSAAPYSTIRQLLVRLGTTCSQKTS